MSFFKSDFHDDLLIFFTIFGSVLNCAPAPSALRRWGPAPGIENPPLPLGRVGPAPPAPPPSAAAAAAPRATLGAVAPVRVEDSRVRLPWAVLGSDN